MVSRRSPRWLVEAVAWAAALVLMVAVAVVASGVIEHRTTVGALGETPVVTDLGPSPLPSKHHAPVVRRMVTNAPRPQAAVSVGSSIAELGAPPGPRKDLVPDRFAAPEDRWALVVGVTHYHRPTHDTLAGARDAEFVRQYLLANGWLPDHLMVLTDEQATGKAMRRGLAWLAARSTPGTFTLFHYSGHVKQAGGHEKLWPVDRQFINDTEVASALNRGAGKMWVDIAGCESGGFIEDLPSDRVLVTTSSKRTQKSYEHPYWRESVWLGLLWDSGLNQGQADADRNGIVTIGEATRYAAYWAQVVTYTQRPYGPQSPQVKGMPVRGWTLANPPA